MRGLRRPVVNAIQKRTFAAQAQPNIKKDGISKFISVSGGTSPLSLTRFVVVYRAGARYEAVENLGATHAIRAGLLSGDLMRTKMFGCLGNLSCTTTRDHIICTLDTTVKNTEDVTGLLFEQLPSLFLNQEFEVEEVKRDIRRDLALLRSQPDVRVIDAVHKAAYRNTSLGNSLYMSECAVDGLSLDMLKSHLAENCTDGNMALLVNLPEELIQQKLPFGAYGPLSSLPAAKYTGGEVRIENQDETVHAAVVTEGVSLESKDLLPMLVLQRIMGRQPRIKYQQGTSALHKAATTAALAPASASCISASYNDSGLFGFHMSAHYKETGKVLKEVMTSFANATKGSISDADVQRAKAMLLVDALTDQEHTGRRLESICLRIAENNASAASHVAQNEFQPAVNYSPLVNTMNMEERSNEPEVPVEEIKGFTKLTLEQRGQLLANLWEKNSVTPWLNGVEAEVNAVTTEQVQAIAKKVINSKPSMAVVGNLTHTPYLDELV